MSVSRPMGAEPGDGASFGALLNLSRQAAAEAAKADGLDDGSALLLPLVLALARLAARHDVQDDAADTREPGHCRMRCRVEGLDATEEGGE